MSKIFVIGVADAELSIRQQNILAGCLLIVATPRLRCMVARFPAHFCEITPLAGALKSIHTTLAKGNVAVLASGDPLFFGIGRRLIADFKSENIEFLPATSSVQRACALFHLPWDDAKITSLHGRKVEHLPGLLLCHSKHLVLTDGVNSPDRIAKQILEYLSFIGETSLPADIEMLVAEDIGLPGEKVFRGSLSKALTHKFSPLNIVCLLIPDCPSLPFFHLGLTENDLHHSRGLITKNEVRAASLHALRLPPRGIFWDIGAGSGSLSIEAARLNPHLTIYAIEQKEEELKNIKSNIVKFRCFNIIAVPGRAPEVLQTLPDPQRIFIGGSGGALPTIIPTAAIRLAKDGILVANGVAQKTLETAPKLMRSHGFNVHSSIIQVARCDTDGNIQTFNPITIMTGTR